MPRRRKRFLIDPNDPGTAIGLLMALGLIWVVGQLLQQVSRGSGGGIGLVILVGGAAVLAYPVVRFLRRVGGRRTLVQKVEATIEQQKNSLVRSRAQLVQKDA